MQQLGIIGCGNMGFSIARSLKEPVLVYDSDRSKVEALVKLGNATAADTLEELIHSSTCILLAVKPQVLPSLYETLRNNKSADKQWISIAAGIPLSVLCEALKTNEVVRFMPNLAAQMQASVTAYAPAEGCSEELCTYARSVAESFGSAFRLPESQFSAFIGISGSAIAYVLQFFHALAMGGVSQGIPYADAVKIAIDTTNSAVALAKQSKVHPIELASAVCSAGGTTIKGMQALAKGSFDAVVGSAVEAAAEQSRHLEMQAMQTNINR